MGLYQSEANKAGELSEVEEEGNFLIQRRMGRIQNQEKEQIKRTIGLYWARMG